MEINIEEQEKEAETKRIFRRIGWLLILWFFLGALLAIILSLLFKGIPAAILTIISKDDLTYGIFNYSNEGECSWFEFAQKIKEFSNSTIEINPVPTSAYPTKAKRPAYSLLDKSKIKEVYQLDIPTWEDSLKEELKYLI